MLAEPNLGTFKSQHSDPSSRLGLDGVADGLDLYRGDDDLEEMYRLDDEDDEDFDPDDNDNDLDDED